MRTLRQSPNGVHISKVLLKLMPGKVELCCMFKKMPCPISLYRVIQKKVAVDFKGNQMVTKWSNGFKI